MYFLSELYNKIGQILEEHGDMPVVRHQTVRLDNLTTDIDRQFINYDNQCTHIVSFTSLKRNYFVIDVPYEDR